MKKLIFLVLIILVSCKETKIESLKKQNEIKDTIENVQSKQIDPETQEVGNLYRPEMMQQEQIENKNGKNNYQYTLTKSDLLDMDLKNLKNHADKIVIIYYRFLIRINKPFEYDKIIVKIIHRNGKTDIFEYSEKDMKQIL